MKAAPFSLRASAYPAVNAHPGAGPLPTVEPGGGFGGGKRGLSFSPPGGSGGQGDRGGRVPGSLGRPAGDQHGPQGGVLARDQGASHLERGRTALVGVGTAAWPLAAGVARRWLGPGAGTAALPAVNVIDRPAAVRMTSPAEEAVTDGTAPVVVRVRPPWAGRGTGRLVVPGHTMLVPLGPSDALTVSLVAALTVAECRLARLDDGGRRQCHGQADAGRLDGLAWLPRGGHAGGHRDRHRAAVPRGSGTGRSGTRSALAPWWTGSRRPTRYRRRGHRPRARRPGP